MLRQFGKMRDELIQRRWWPHSYQRWTFLLQQDREVREDVTRIRRSHKGFACTWSYVGSVRDDFDKLIESTEQERTDAMSSLHNCKLGKQFIGMNANIMQNLSFDSGVVKIQKGAAQDLLTDEKKAVSSLRKKAVATWH